ncbi:MAG: glycosyltransferase WbuB [Pseudomonadota bacterium]|nr:glycosyltransferase WbuB [Pseudomonadota bacterium]
MKIVIYGLNYAPELTGIGKYSGEMAEWLCRQGHEVRVIAAPPYYPGWKVFSGYSARVYRREVINGVAVTRCPLWVPGKQSGVRRLLHLASFAASSLPVIVGQALWRPDIIFVVEPPFACAPAALLAARLCGAKSWLHVQDFEIDAAFELGLLPGKRSRRMIHRIERWLMRRFDRVSTISHRMLARLRIKGVAPDKAVFFPNWIDTRWFYPLGRVSAYRAELGISDNAIVALYSGNMGRKQGLEILGQAARKLAGRQNLVFVLCGDGAGRRGLMQMTAGLPNVRFLDLQPFDRLNELLNLADIHLLPQRQDAADLVMPSKLTGMLASGIPVLATCANGTEVAEVLQTCGVITPPGDVEAFVAALEQLAADDRQRARLGRAGRIYAENHFDQDAVLEGFLRTLQTLKGISDRRDDLGEQL